MVNRDSIIAGQEYKTIHRDRFNGKVNTVNLRIRVIGVGATLVSAEVINTSCPTRFPVGHNLIVLMKDLMSSTIRLT